LCKVVGTVSGERERERGRAIYNIYIYIYIYIYVYIEREREREIGICNRYSWKPLWVSQIACPQGCEYKQAFAEHAENV